MEPGNGLITRILKTTAPRIYNPPRMVLNYSAIKSDSDRALLQRLANLGAKKKRDGKLNRKDERARETIIRKLESHGGITLKRREEWPD